jgi:hypothetical protein
MATSNEPHVRIGSGRPNSALITVCDYIHRASNSTHGVCKKGQTHARIRIILVYAGGFSLLLAGRSTRAPTPGASLDAVLVYVCVKSGPSRPPGSLSSAQQGGEEKTRDQLKLAVQHSEANRIFIES